MNLEIVKAGLAWHYKKYQREQTESDRKLYSQVENEARKNNYPNSKDESFFYFG
ncbi:MAG: thermonuclease family protein [Gammaproteobacteria bacterium]|nr:thermonuclease family protein [Gammaproteobacteria bacterium]